MIRLAPVFFFLFGCASGPPVDESSGDTFPAVWDFEIVDKEQTALGSIRLRLTMEPVDEDYCGGSYFRKAKVLRDDLKIDLYKSLQPVWHVFARGLSIDLTASTCNTNYLFIGSINPEEASGYFNYAHPLGGEYIGRFIGTPVVQPNM